MSRQRVRKAVIAAAGFGTRLLPQTKAMPKEMLPLVDKPIIQYIVEQLAEAGIEDIVIVTGYHKRAIEDHFDTLSADLRANLRQGDKHQQLDEVKSITNLANFAYVRQKGPYGSATPILNTAHLIGDEPFIYTYADDLILATPNRFQQMIELYDELGGTILPCVTVTDDSDYDKYGMVDGEVLREGVLRLNRLVEKPSKEAAPSNLASVGGYLLTPDVCRYAEQSRAKLRPGQEFYLTTYALEPMINDGQKLYACQLQDSTYYDTGTKLGYVKTVVDFALRHDDIQDEFRTYLKDLSL